MRNCYFTFLFLLFAIGCKTDKADEKAITKSQISTSEFEIKGSFDAYLCDTVYLNAIHDHLIIPIDSTAVAENTFSFTGVIAEPERYALSFPNYSKRLVLVIENASIAVKIYTKDLENPVITGSPLNDLMASYQASSKAKFKEIESLFPQFQKARLENDAEKLTEIASLMKEVEEDVSTYTYAFIAENSASYIAGMILRDQLKIQPIDTIKIKDAYNNLSTKVKNSPDGQIISTALGLH